MIRALVWLISVVVGRDPLAIHLACDRIGLDTRRWDLREAIMARGKIG